MSLGEKIYELRKKKGLSQEQLGEEVNVTRQTISNWELGETSPNPEQLKILSKVLNVSIDELLDNDIKNVLEEKVSNTEKLAGIIVKVLKWIGILVLTLVVVDIIVFLIFLISGRKISEENVKDIEMQCSIEDSDYTINVGSDGYFNCSNCSNDIQKDLKDNYVDFSDMDKTKKNIEKYFDNNNGICK